MQVPILDPQIHIKPGYAPYDQGIAQGIFIKDMTGQPYNGQACTRVSQTLRFSFAKEGLRLEVKMAIIVHREG